MTTDSMVVQAGIKFKYGISNSYLNQVIYSSISTQAYLGSYEMI